MSLTRIFKESAKSQIKDLQQKAIQELSEHAGLNILNWSGGKQHMKHWKIRAWNHAGNIEKGQRMISSSGSILHLPLL
ncbi:MAG: hypothetical protein EOM64_00550 [Erysipelotrichia bacterium]|nr:hypothetical protein [Erysipelotrichia bacterium]